MTKFLATAAICAGLTALALPALSHSGATGIVKARMDAMTEIADGMKTLAAVVKARAGIDSETTREAVATINRHAAAIPELFPDGSVHPKSEARQAIWNDWAAFTDIADDLAAAAAAMQGAVDDGDHTALRDAFAEAGDTCKRCHETFRLKKDG